MDIFLKLHCILVHFGHDTIALDKTGIRSNNCLFIKNEKKKRKKKKKKKKKEKKKEEKC